MESVIATGQLDQHKYMVGIGKGLLQQTGKGTFRPIGGEGKPVYKGRHGNGKGYTIAKKMSAVHVFRFTGIIGLTQMELG